MPPRILRQCADSLALPMYFLALSILRYGVWPRGWGMHWIAAIYKKKSVYDARNYRGVHMTAQLAKAVERLLQKLFSPVLMTEASIGENQFAYCKGRGSRDAMAFLMLSWILAFQSKQRIALYMSDVAAAFDRVFMDRLVAKLKARSVPKALLDVFISWLQARRAVVVVGGSKSHEFTLQNMVFQGTVWGPLLWNVFYEDASTAIRLNDFVELGFADDLNAFRTYESNVGNSAILQDMEECQDELHKWGMANQVSFDATKESKHILSRTQSYGAPFDLLGVRFDCKLLMTDTVSDLVKTCRWKLNLYSGLADLILERNWCYCTRHNCCPLLNTAHRLFIMLAGLLWKV